MLSDLLKPTIEETLSRVLNKNCQVKSLQPIGGGCINEAFRLKTTAGDFFIKWNDCHRYPGMFGSEARGLMLLKSVDAIYIPQVIVQNEVDPSSFIILEWIETGRKIKNFGTDFGERLARLHGHSNELFGLNHDNYIGSLSQSNKQHKTWKEFFIQERLWPQLKLALDTRRIDASVTYLFEKLFHKLDNLIPGEKPALLHGDLWSGNYLFNQQGAATLIDPAVYYGHREMDLAMTKLFGGFDNEFYSAYQNTYQLQPGYEQRIDIYNLYPLLVHVNLFGGSYASQVKRILQAFE